MTTANYTSLFVLVTTNSTENAQQVPYLSPQASQFAVDADFYYDPDTQTLVVPVISFVDVLIEGDIIFTNDADHSILVLPTTGATPGRDLTITAGGSVNGSGGDLILDAGNSTGSTDGIVEIGTTVAEGVEIGRTGQTTLVNGFLSVTEFAIFDDGAEVTGSFGVIGPTLLTGNLDVTGDVLVQTDLNVQGDAAFDQDVDITGDLTVTGNLVVDGTIDLNLGASRVLFGATNGSGLLATDSGFLFDSTTRRETVPRELISETITGVAASTERNALQVQATVQFATGALATQRSTAFDRPTYSAVGASVITTASTVAIKGTPIAGTNVTITNPYSLHVEAGRSQFDGEIACPGAGGSTSLRIGPSSVASNVNCTSHGASSVAGPGSSASAYGANSSAAGAAAMALGASASAAQTGAIAVGNGATTTAANQCVIGGPSSFLTFISNLFIGSGVTDTAPTSAAINGTGGSGSNVAGGSLTLAGGRSTGNATPAPVIISTGTVGGSGSTAQTLSERARFDGLGNFLLGTTSGNTATKSLVLGSTIAGVPGSPGNDLYIAGVTGGGNTKLSIYSNQAVEATPAVSTHRVEIYWNGVSYRIPLEVV